MSKSLILDTNLAVLLIVGLASRDQVGVHKRTRSFDQRDFEILEGVLAESSGLIFTPNVLTETSNLLRQTNGHHAAQLSIILSQIVAKSSKEVAVISEAAFARKEYERLGLTDAALLHLSATAGDSLIFTDDLDLYLAAASDGLGVINFTHIRAQRPDF